MESRKELTAAQYCSESVNLDHRGRDPWFPVLVGRKYVFPAAEMETYIPHQLLFSFNADVINTGQSIFTTLEAMKFLGLP